MRKIMIFQHVGHEPLGTLNPMLKAAGFRIRYVNFGRDPECVPDLEGYSGLIVLGGPMGVYEADQFPHLKTEMKLIEEAMKRDIPILGICLGSQLIAAVLGSHVRKSPHTELGWYDVHTTPAAANDPLFQDYRPTEKIFQLHQDMFDPPRNSEHLAFSKLCQGQAFRYGQKVYGLQFHLEADRPMIVRWLHRPENRKMIEDSPNHQSLQSMEKDTETFIQRSLELSEQTFSKFIEIFKLPERSILLGTTHGSQRKP